MTDEAVDPMGGMDDPWDGTLDTDSLDDEAEEGVLLVGATV